MRAEDKVIYIMVAWGTVLWYYLLQSVRDHPDLKQNYGGKKNE